MSLPIVAYPCAMSLGEPGGFLASVLPPVADLQAQVLGLAKQTAEDTAAIRADTEVIRREMKRESSDDPRKELQNRGVAWSARGPARAIRFTREGATGGTP